MIKKRTLKLNAICLILCLAALPIYKMVEQLGSGDEFYLFLGRRAFFALTYAGAAIVALTSFMLSNPRINPKCKKTLVKRKIWFIFLGFCLTYFALMSATELLYVYYTVSVFDVMAVSTVAAVTFFNKYAEHHKKL